MPKIDGSIRHHEEKKFKRKIDAVTIASHLKVMTLYDEQGVEVDNYNLIRGRIFCRMGYDNTQPNAKKI
ncbi:hypothetical protein GCM10011396_38820 [Undibacterium terreum]|uniref:Uncharacterized protein n=1 Tax=Undibacterium terreum TaxID=1224302 RepID=A0A916UUM8_9BURK|nr:hypothetical protein GCM10011396_38820 [Undibacterium terreum]